MWFDGATHLLPRPKGSGRADRATCPSVKEHHAHDRHSDQPGPHPLPHGHLGPALHGPRNARGKLVRSRAPLACEWGWASERASSRQLGRTPRPRPSQSAKGDGLPLLFLPLLSPPSSPSSPLSARPLCLVAPALPRCRPSPPPPPRALPPPPRPPPARAARCASRRACSRWFPPASRRCGWPSVVALPWPGRRDLGLLGRLACAVRRPLRAAAAARLRRRPVRAPLPARSSESLAL